LCTNYTGSGLVLNNFKKKYGLVNNFHLQILNWCHSQEELNFTEILSICTAKHLFGKSCINLMHGGAEGGHSRTTRRKLSRRHRGVPKSPEAKANHLEAMRRPEVRAKMSASAKRKIITDEYLDTLRKAMNRQEVREKCREARLGVLHTDEAKERIRAGLMRPEVQVKLHVKKTTVNRMELVKCPHCDKIGAVNLMNKYHFDNCAEFAGRRPREWVDPRDVDSARRLGRSHATVGCPHCGTEGGSNTMKRWHFDNCKLNSNQQGAENCN
jgi:hypothetical protein